MNIFFLPCISAYLPNGSRNAALARTNAVGIQPNRIMFTDRSFWINGKAMLSEEPMKGTRNDPKATISSAEVLTFLLLLFSAEAILINPTPS